MSIHHVLTTSAFLLAAALTTTSYAEEDKGLPQYPMLVHPEHLAGASIQAVSDLPGSETKTLFADDGTVLGFVVKATPYKYCRAEFWADKKGIIQIATGLTCAQPPKQ